MHSLREEGGKGRGEGGGFFREILLPFPGFSELFRNFPTGCFEYFECGGGAQLDPVG